MKNLWSLLILALVASSSYAQEKPNILIIHTDDLGYHDLSLTGSELYDTPNIDGLAKKSVQFTNAYSSYPRCTPSRYAMMTGTYPVNEDKGYLGGISDDKNMVKQFNKAGYNTGFIGKWHLGENESDPKGFGYDYSYAAGRAGGVGQRYYPFNTQKNGKEAKEIVPDVEEDSQEGDYISDVMTGATIDFIKNNTGKQPFLAVLSFYAVHTPLEAKKEDKQRNKKQLESMTFEGPDFLPQGEGRNKQHQDDADYAGMVENVDENVGKLLKTLKDLGIDKNTIVVFSSDHGGLSNDGNKRERELATSNLPLKAGKGWLYEGGIRVPLFVKWADQLEPRVDQQSIIVGMDIFPTLMDLAIDQKIDGIDGKSFEPVLRADDTWDERTVFWHSNKARPHSTGDSKMSVVRSGDYKLVMYNKENRTELYNLKEDISEQNDLSATMPGKAQELTKTLKAWKREYLVPEKMDMWKSHRTEMKAKKKKKK
ncbi:Arylsulfatase A [Nonlabens sp. Hel1_33_55]|uniref:sulfatase n=1 Tax=Nonlabens sp. Hel1_33_55 TaxID=1336802 RepID=UPI000875BF20|nr:sulfatase [Nonlabens sp. Hel1_33_55]SCX99673.1 Arylsulfatase A [Nonlabens sp. Hel1_33_55]